MFMILVIRIWHLTQHKQLHWTQCNQENGSKLLTAEGRTPPSAVYRESFPTGIPIPCYILINEKLLKQQDKQKSQQQLATEMHGLESTQSDC